MTIVYLLFYVFVRDVNSQTVPKSVIGPDERRWEGGSPTLCLPEIQSPQTAQQAQACVPCSPNSRFLPSKIPEVVVDGFTSKEDAGSQINPSEMLVRDDDGPETEIQPVRQVVVVCEPPWTPH
ncbi:hypothetical protein AMECASPLE_001325 [Ameca splendens]|uniref:Uncharacterized protein n=1 Tax=Ameca splendens TaxID=208324 RepID=A0ABV0ZTT9_9TELE